MLTSIALYLSKQKKIAERLRQSQFSEAMIEQIKRVGKLEGLAGRGEWLGQYVEQVWHEFLVAKKNMPNPIGANSMPDVIEQWTDKQLWRFRIHYQGYIGSMEAVDPQCDSELMNHKLPHECESYLSVKRKIEAHVQTMRTRAAETLSKAKAEMAK